MSALSENRDFNRRKFLGTLTGAAALAMMGFDRRAIASDAPSLQLLADYQGRLCYNENPLGPSQAAIDAIRNQAELAHRYPDWFGESLTRAVAQKYGVSTDNVICGSGGTEMLRLSAMAFCQSGKNVVVPNPTYSQFPTDAQIFGATVRYSSLNGDYIINLESMRNLVNTNTTAVCITNPNNPTGTIVNANDLVSFVDSLPSYVATVIDEAYLEYISGEYPSAIEMVRNNKNVIVIKTFSKAHGLAGARIGYAVGKASYITLMRNKQFMTTISRSSLEAAKASLNETQHIADTVDLATRCKEYCFNRFSQIGLEFIGSEASFFMVDVGTNADPIRAELESRGFYTRTGWGMPNHLRVSTGTWDETQKFVAILEQVLNDQYREMRPNPIMTTQLYQADPNPFNSSTMIRIYIPGVKSTRLEIFDIQGRLVNRLVDGILGPGEHSFIWNGTDSDGGTVATGAYFYRLICGDDVMTRKMLLIK